MVVRWLHVGRSILLILVDFVVVVPATEPCLQGPADDPRAKASRLEAWVQGAPARDTHALRADHLVEWPDRIRDLAEVPCQTNAMTAFQEEADGLLGIHEAFQEAAIGTITRDAGAGGSVPRSP